MVICQLVHCVNVQCPKDQILLCAIRWQATFVSYDTATQSNHLLACGGILNYVARSCDCMTIATGGKTMDCSQRTQSDSLLG